MLILQFFAGHGFSNFQNQETYFIAFIWIVDKLYKHSE